MNLDHLPMSRKQVLSIAASFDARITCWSGAVRSGKTIGLGHDVQHIVKTVDEIDISVARRTEHHLCPRRLPAGRMARLVFRSDVSFRLDNSPGSDAIRVFTNKVLANQLPGDVHRCLLVKRARQLHRLSESCTRDTATSTIVKVGGFAHLACRWGNNGLAASGGIQS